MAAKSLYLFRHAKSSWDHPALADFDRPLNQRGQKAAPAMGKVMREKNVRPEAILCSPARRTRQTVELAAGTAGLACPVSYSRRLYAADLSDLYAVLSAVEDNLSAVMVIGHNPGLEELLADLTGRAEPVPTAALAHIVLSLDSWSGIRRGCGRLDWMVRPRDVMDK